MGAHQGPERRVRRVAGGTRAVRRRGGHLVGPDHHPPRGHGEQGSRRLLPHHLRQLPDQGEDRADDRCAGERRRWRWRGRRRRRRGREGGGRGGGGGPAGGGHVWWRRRRRRLLKRSDIVLTKANGVERATHTTVALCTCRSIVDSCAQENKDASTRDWE